jgi:hypothetical protein
MNLGYWGRTWRLIIGCILLTWAIAGGPAWAYVGVYFLLCGSFGFSLIRAILRQRNSNSDF